MTLEQNLLELADILANIDMTLETIEDMGDIVEQEGEVL